METSCQTSCIDPHQEDYPTESFGVGVGGHHTSNHCHTKHGGTRCQVWYQETDRWSLLSSRVQTQPNQQKVVRRLWSTTVHWRIWSKRSRKPNEDCRVRQLFQRWCETIYMDQPTVHGGYTMDVYQHEKPQCTWKGVETCQRVWPTLDFLEIVSSDVELWSTHCTRVAATKMSILEIDQSCKAVELLWDDCISFWWMCSWNGKSRQWSFEETLDSGHEPCWSR